MPSLLLLRIRVDQPPDAVVPPDASVAGEAAGEVGGPDWHHARAQLQAVLPRAQVVIPIDRAIVEHLDAVRVPVFDLPIWAIIPYFTFR